MPRLGAPTRRLAIKLRTACMVAANDLGQKTNDKRRKAKVGVVQKSSSWEKTPRASGIDRRGVTVFVRASRENVFSCRDSERALLRET